MVWYVGYGVKLLEPFEYLPRKKKSFAWEVGGAGAMTTGYGGKGEGRGGEGGGKGGVEGGRDVYCLGCYVHNQNNLY